MSREKHGSGFWLVNRSGYDSADLRRFFAAGIRATGLRKKGLTIKVVSLPSRTKGCADLHGKRMVFALAPPSRMSMRRFARVFEHEAAHIRGLDHGEMPASVRYSEGPLPTWARGLRVRYRGRAPRQLASLKRDQLTRF